MPSQLLSHHVWLQYLKGEVDPCGIWSEIEKICYEGGNESGFAEIVNHIVEAVDPIDIEEDAHSHVLDRAGVSIPISFGGFQRAITRLSVLFEYGSQSGMIRARYGKENPDWPMESLRGCICISDCRSRW